MLSKLLYFLLSPLLFSSSAWAIDPTCIDHFKRNKIEPGSYGCVIKCETTKIDMNTFSCSEACSEYCKDPCIKILERLSKRLLDGLPAHWPLKESSSEWTDKEKHLATESLSRLPETFLEKSDFNVYRMKRSRSYPNPAANSDSLPSAIVVYDTAFSDKYTLDEVLFHETAHLYYRQISAEQKDSYNLKMNWFLVDKIKNKWISRSDGFVADDGRLSPEEDFANNLENYLFHPEKLKAITPNAFTWMHDTFGKISLQKGCRHAK